MNLVGERVELRPCETSELEVFSRWTHDPEINQFMFGRGFTLEEEKQWFERVQQDPNEQVWSIYLKAEEKLIGNCALRKKTPKDIDPLYRGKSSLGIMIGEKDEWGKGYGGEVVELLKKQTKENGASELFLTVDISNKKAQRCYRKCGFEVIEERLKKGNKEALGREYIMEVSL